MIFNIYLDKSQIESRLKIPNLINIKTSSKFWKTLLEDICLSLKQQPINSQKAIPLMNILDCLMLALCWKPIEDRAFYYLPGIKLGPILLELTAIIESNRLMLENLDSPFHGKFITYLEYFYWLLVLLVGWLYSGFSLTDESYTTMDNLIYQEILSKLDDKKVRPFVRYRHYFRKQDRCAVNDSRHKKVAHDLSLSQHKLDEIIMSKEILNCEDLNINLRLTLRSLRGNYKTSTILNTQEKENLSSSVSLYICQITNNKDLLIHEVEKLKHVGVFLSAVLTFSLDEFEEIRSKFLFSVIPFFSQKCQMSVWDLSFFQESLWNLIQVCSDPKNIIIEKSFSDLMKILEVKMSKGVLKTKTPSNWNQKIQEDSDVKDLIYSMIFSSVSEIENDLLNLGNIYNIEQGVNLQILQANYIKTVKRRYLYHTLDWITYYIDITKSEKSGEEKLDKIVIKMSSFYFHPIFCLFVDKRENRILNEKYSPIIRADTKKSPKVVLAFSDISKVSLATINSEISASNSSRQKYAKLIKSNPFNEQYDQQWQFYKDYPQSYSEETIRFHVFISGILKLTSVIEPSQYLPDVILVEKDVENLKETIFGLQELLSNIRVIEKQEKQEDLDNNSSKDNYIPLISQIEKATATFIKYLSEHSQLENIIAQSISTVLVQSLIQKEIKMLGIQSKD